MLEDEVKMLEGEVKMVGVHLNMAVPLLWSKSIKVVVQEEEEEGS